MMQNAFASITIPKQSLRVSRIYVDYKTHKQHLQFNRHCVMCIGNIIAYSLSFYTLEQQQHRVGK